MNELVDDSLTFVIVPFEVGNLSSTSHLVEGGGGGDS
jgi:hypothetical protein